MATKKCLTVSDGNSAAMRCVFGMSSDQPDIHEQKALFIKKLIQYKNSVRELLDAYKNLKSALPNDDLKISKVSSSPLRVVDTPENSCSACQPQYDYDISSMSESDDPETPSDDEDQASEHHACSNSRQVDHPTMKPTDLYQLFTKHTAPH